MRGGAWWRWGLPLSVACGVALVVHGVLVRREVAAQLSGHASTLAAEPVAAWRAGLERHALLEAKVGEFLAGTAVGVMPRALAEVTPTPWGRLFQLPPDPTGQVPGHIAAEDGYDPTAQDREVAQLSLVLVRLGATRRAMPALADLVLEVPSLGVRAGWEGAVVARMGPATGPAAVTGQPAFEDRSGAWAADTEALGLRLTLFDGQPVLRRASAIGLHRAHPLRVASGTFGFDPVAGAAVDATDALHLALLDPEGRTLGAVQRDEAGVWTPRPLPVDAAAVASVPNVALRRDGDWIVGRVPVGRTGESLVVAQPYAPVLAAAHARAARVSFATLALLLAAFLLVVPHLGVGRRSLRDEDPELPVDHARLLAQVEAQLPATAVVQLHRGLDGSIRTGWIGPRLVEVLGTPAVAVRARWEHLLEVAAPEDAEAVQALGARLLWEAEPWTEEFRVAVRGDRRWIRVHVSPEGRADGTEILTTWTDISDERALRDTVESQRNSLLELADGIPGAVLQWRVTDEGRSVVPFAGRRTGTLLGVSANTVLEGLHALDTVVHEDDLEAVRRARAAASQDRGSYAVEYRVRHPVHGIRWLREEGTPQSMPGHLVAFTVHLRDVTQSRREAAELRRAKEEAEQATRAKSVFLATMSHEIRTPMTGISGMIEVLGRTVLDADQRQQLATIADSARALRRILDDVLDFSRIEAGRMTIERRPISIDDVVEGSAGLYVAAAQERGVRLLTSVDPRLGELLLGDAVRLRQVLGNLLSNAVKFTSRGTVRLTVRQVESDEQERVVEFEVTDTGVGIPHELQPRLFAPFERGTHPVTVQVGGTGLGLALVKRIVELMDGEVELRSLPGVGTAVRILIPFERVHEETSDVRTSLAGLRLGILHATELDARNLAELFTARGAEVQALVPETAPHLPAGTSLDVLVVGPDVSREIRQALQSRLAPGATGRVQIVRLLPDARLRPEVCGDGSVSLAVHARRSALLRAVAIASGRDEPDLPEPTSVSRATEPSVDAAVAARRLILVCEDHPIAQRVIEKQLRVLGHAAELHPHGASGLAAWRTGRYGLILTDLQMPEMDGLTLARRIRAEEARDPSRGRIPIIALSGNAFDEQRVVCVEAGMDDFLAKPAAMNELDATLRFWLPPEGAPVGAPELEHAAEPLPVTLPAPLSHKALREAIGDDPEILRQALAEFLDVDTRDIEALRLAFEAARDAEVGSLAHRIEGAARMLGAASYGRAAERVKRLYAQPADPAERAEAVQMLEQEGERLRTWIHTTRDWFARSAVLAER